ncbi:MAG: Spy/CpxP family protein refolding chaperone [Candidatus Electryonea clarkiae]|nr:Spy/CpxP family protein refolding chaperone [Candidatus Electryonea clarkiae]MDP8285874.1 Spy/CpxP family protein refolding chaperone [Candidatus Electryonea clarkiae]
MHKKQRKTGFGLILAGLFIITTIASAGPGHRGKRHGGYGDMQRGGGQRGGSIAAMINLGLDDKQIDNIINLQKTHMKTQVPLQRKKMEIGKDLQTLRNSDSPDSDKLRDLMTRMAAVQADMQINAIDNRSKAMALLTDEQKAKLGDRPFPMFHGPPGKGRFGWDCDGTRRGWGKGRRGFSGPPFMPDLPDLDAE